MQGNRKTQDGKTEAKEHTVAANLLYKLKILNSASAKKNVSKAV